jgi:hypothetical protein
MLERVEHMHHTGDGVVHATQQQSRQTLAARAYGMQIITVPRLLQHTVLTPTILVLGKVTPAINHSLQPVLHAIKHVDQVLLGHRCHGADDCLLEFLKGLAPL